MLERSFRIWYDKVKQYIAELAGKQFDPNLATKFLKLLEAAKRNPSGAGNRALKRGYDKEIFYT